MVTGDSVHRVPKHGWDELAQSTFELYRSAVLQPGERSLQMRRMMREAIVRWSRSAADGRLAIEEHGTHWNDEVIGVRGAWKALHAAFGRRVGREVRRFQAARARRGA